MRARRALVICALFAGGCQGRRGAGDEGGGGAGGASSSSASGAPSCTSCWSYLSSEDTPDTLCGFDAATQSCMPSSSCERVLALSDCLCGLEQGGGQCLTFCELSCTGTGVDDGCASCMQSACAAAYEACVADPAAQ